MLNCRGCTEFWYTFHLFLHRNYYFKEYGEEFLSFYEALQGLQNFLFLKEILYLCKKLIIKDLVMEEKEEKKKEGTRKESFFDMSKWHVQKPVDIGEE